MNVAFRVEPWTKRPLRMSEAARAVEVPLDHDGGASFVGEPSTVIRALPGGGGRWCIDTTEAELAGEYSVIELRGWIALDVAVSELVEPHLRVRGDRYPLERLARTDVEAEFPGTSVVGFDHVVDLATLRDSTGEVVCVADGRELVLSIPPIARATERAEMFLARKAVLLDRLVPLLACPYGHGRLVERPQSALVCVVCGYTGTRSATQFALAPTEIVPALPLPPFSAHLYDADARAIVDSLSGGLVLDDGCGLRYETFPNVVNLDLSPFPSTDVVGSSAQLPFVEQAFDGLISVAVLEHVPDPARCVAEIARVVRPGGVVFIAVPFLQPYHSYPHHYFNMTRDGMRTLFEPHFEISEIMTPYGGLPMYALTWFLDRYLAGLPEQTRAKLAARPLGEFTGDPTPHLDKDYVTELEPQTVADLASVNVLIGRRRASS